jgi:hypothetical protein
MYKKIKEFFGEWGQSIEVYLTIVVIGFITVVGIFAILEYIFNQL